MLANEFTLVCWLFPKPIVDFSGKNEQEMEKKVDSFSGSGQKQRQQNGVAHTFLLSFHTLDNRVLQNTIDLGLPNN